MKRGGILKLLLLCLLCMGGRPIAMAAQAADDAPETVKLVYFTSSSCDDCLKVKKAMPDLIAGLEEVIVIKKYDIDDPSGEGLAQLFSYLDRYNLGDIAPPIIFVDKTALVGDVQIIEKLQETIIAHLTGESVSDHAAETEKPVETETPQEAPSQENSPDKDKEHDVLPGDDAVGSDDVPGAEIAGSAVSDPIPDTPETPAAAAETPPADTAEDKVLEKFNKFSLGAVAVAGLLDGVNPCAFTTIVFFISMLAYLGKSKRQIIIVGCGFTFAVFVTYLLLGLGLFGAVKSFFVTQGITQFVTRLVAVVTFLLAGWSVVDLIKYLRTRNAQSMTLGLPKSIKAKIHKVIRVGMGTRGLLAGAIGVGVLVALLESVCTGQIYLPVIIFVAKSSTVRLDAVGYLLLYNLMFIVPLIVIFIITYYGVSSQSLGNFLGRHLVLAKLTMALLFVGLGLLLLLV